jgi:hypothetical protein
VSEKPENPPIYWIEWIDSTTRGGWLERHESKAADIRCLTIGFFAKEDDETITLSGCYSRLENWLDPITIPKVAITKIEEVLFQT